MRPVAGDDPFGARSRGASFTGFADNAAERTPRPQVPQTTYFMTTERELQSSSSSRSPPLSHARSRESMKVSSYGVESLETTTASLPPKDPHEQGLGLRTARSNWKKNLTKNTTYHDEQELGRSRSPSPLSVHTLSRDLSPAESRRNENDKAISQPFTPLFSESPFLGSVRSNPSSRRNSEIDFLTDDAASQVIMSSDEEHKEPSVSLPSQVLDNRTDSQLVMPSISMPQRRPFTEAGKHLGRLKVLLAGDSGLGKTTLIKSIVQLCPHIVHVDPLSSPSSSLLPSSVLSSSSTSKRKSKGRASSSSHLEIQSTTRITEVYASTRAYPHWYAELDDGKQGRRRRSSGEKARGGVLERNVCFVDTPGFTGGTGGTSCMEAVTPIIGYVEFQLERSAGLGVGGMTVLTDGMLMSLLSGRGGAGVDVVFYLISERITPPDLHTLRRLSQLTNVIPLIARSDTLSPSDLSRLKSDIASDLKTAGIETFSFHASFSSSSPPGGGGGVTEVEVEGGLYAVSSRMGGEGEEGEMEASLLMSPDYVPPLHTSDLPLLISAVFSPDGVAQLRHFAARKAVRWLRSRINTNSSMALSRGLVVPSQGLTLGRVDEHSRREEQRAQVRLANWAADLARSMANERARFEALKRGERATWLLDRVSEQVAEGAIASVPLPAAAGQGVGGELEEMVMARQPLTIRDTVRERREQRRAKATSLSASDSASGATRTHSRCCRSSHDPLGLTALQEEMRRRSWLAVKIVGSFGLLGGIVVWLSRSGPAMMGMGLGAGTQGEESLRWWEWMGLGGGGWEW